MMQLQPLLSALTSHDVEFIVIGGVAGTIHGSAHATFDLDIVYRRDRENHQRLQAALAPTQPRLRGAPEGLPFRWDAETIERGLNFTLSTTLGDIDVLGHVAGGGTYEELRPHTTEFEAYGARFRVVSLARLILLKRAAGRVKDFNMIAELEALLEASEHKAPSERNGGAGEAAPEWSEPGGVQGAPPIKK